MAFDADRYVHSFTHKNISQQDDGRRVVQKPTTNKTVILKRVNETRDEKKVDGCYRSHEIEVWKEIHVRTVAVFVLLVIAH